MSPPTRARPSRKSLSTTQPAFNARSRAMEQVSAISPERWQHAKVTDPATREPSSSTGESKRQR